MEDETVIEISRKCLLLEKFQFYLSRLVERIQTEILKYYKFGPYR
jgi:hypothetical protein